MTLIEQLKADYDEAVHDLLTSGVTESRFENRTKGDRLAQLQREYQSAIQFAVEQGGDHESVQV